MKILCNVLIYQAIWFFSVLGGNKGAYVGILLLCVHLSLSKVRRADVSMMVLLLLAGFLVDGTLQYVGFFTFTESGFPIPFWLMTIWLGLAITPHHSLAWLQKRPLLSMVLGALGGPVAYWGGARLGVATFSWDLLPSLFTLALIWASLWPIVMYLSVLSEKHLVTNRKE